MDLTTLALCKKIANNAASGIISIEVDGLDLIITTKDGSKVIMTFPKPKDGASITNLEINNDNHLIVYFSNGTSIDAGLIPTKKGEDGYSPSITVKENTDEKYILTIQDKNSKYDTPNLKGESILKVLEGTLENPIDLNLLNYDIYYIKGYFKKNSTSTIEYRKNITVFTVTEDDFTYNKIITYNIVKKGSPIIIMISYNSDGTYIELYSSLNTSEWEGLETETQAYKEEANWETL